MNTLEVLKYQNASEELKDVIENGEAVSGDDIAIARAYQDMTRDWIEVYQLYQLFDWNYEQYKKGLCVDYDDSVSSLASSPSSDSIGIAVNGYVANYISAGRNLADSMERILKAETGKDSLAYQRYKQAASEKYDKKQAYYLFYELRNYVQHGQTVVSTHGDGRRLYACFDLGQLREPAHFSAKPKIIASMNKWAYRIDEFDGPIKLSLGHYVEEFNYEIRDLYSSFLNAIQKHIGSVSKDFYRMLSRHPSYVRTGPDGRLFVFYEEEGTIHLVHGIQDRVDGGSVRKRESLIKKDCRKAKKALKEWSQHFVRAEKNF